MSIYLERKLQLVVPLDEIYGGTGTNTYNTGDTLYATNSSTLTKLPIGATGQVVTSTGTVPNWSTNNVKGDTGATGATGATGPATPICTMASINLYSIVSQTVANADYFTYNTPASFASSIYTYTANSVTMTVGGIYMVAMHVFGPVDPMVYNVGMSINGAAALAKHSFSWSDNDDISGMNLLVQLSIGDIIRVQNNSGGSRTFAPPVANTIGATLNITLIKYI
jgi:hypothetical protein